MYSLRVILTISVGNSGYAPAGTGCCEVLSYESVIETRQRDWETRERYTNARTDGRYVTSYTCMFFQCHAMTTSAVGCGRIQAGRGGTHFGPKSIYVDFSHNYHLSSSYVLPSHWLDLSHSCLREIAWGVKEWGILGHWRARDGVCIHTSSVRSGVRFRALEGIRCMAKIVTALWNFWTVQQLATNLQHVKGLSVVLKTHAPQYIHTTFPKHHPKNKYTTLHTHDVSKASP